MEKLENFKEEDSQEIIVPIPDSEKQEEKKLSLEEVIARFAPGKSLRTALNDILEGESGALIVVDSPNLREILDGGFRINCRLTPQRLAELAKMDGAIVLSDDLKKILFANVLLVPDSSIQSNETGTRHKAAERTAKQIGTLAIAVSERRNKITLFFGDKKYILEDSENLLRRATETLNILEKQRETFDETLRNLNVLEISKLVSAGDVCVVLQRGEVINKMMSTMKKYLTELGNQGVILRMRIKEISKDMENTEDLLLRDYSSKPANAKKILSSMSFEGVIDTEGMSRMIFELSPEAQMIPKGFRLLGRLNLTDREIKAIVSDFGDLSNILASDTHDFESILKSKAVSFKKELDNLKEQILMGKKI